MYQLLLQQDPPVKTTTYILLLQPNHWKHGGNPGRPPTQGQDSTTAVQPFWNFSPNFLSLLFLTFFAAIQDTGHHVQCLLVHFLNLSSCWSDPHDHHLVGRLKPLTLPLELCYVLSMDLIPLEHPTVSQSFFFLFHHVSCYVLVLSASVCLSVIWALYLLYGTMCMSMCFSMLLSMHLAHNIHFVPQARARRLRIEITTRLVERSWAKNL